MVRYFLPVVDTREDIWRRLDYVACDELGNVLQDGGRPEAEMSQPQAVRPFRAVSGSGEGATQTYHGLPDLLKPLTT